jgi:hypothetical protein
LALRRGTASAAPVTRPDGSSELPEEPLRETVQSAAAEAAPLVVAVELPFPNDDDTDDPTPCFKHTPAKPADAGQLLALLPAAVVVAVASESGIQASCSCAIATRRSASALISSPVTQEQEALILATALEAGAVTASMVAVGRPPDSNSDSWKEEPLASNCTEVSAPVKSTADFTAREQLRALGGDTGAPVISTSRRRANQSGTIGGPSAAAGEGSSNGEDTTVPAVGEAADSSGEQGRAIALELLLVAPGNGPARARSCSRIGVVPTSTGEVASVYETPA